MEGKWKYLCLKGLLQFDAFYLAEVNIDVECSSVGAMYEECPVDFPISNVIVKEQYSKTDCIKDDSFGISTDGKSIWVDNGCRAMFTVTLEDQSKYISKINSLP